MMKQLRKVFSILCAIALLLSSMANALAEETDPAEEAAEDRRHPPQEIHGRAHFELLQEHRGRHGRAQLGQGEGQGQ